MSNTRTTRFAVDSMLQMWVGPLLVCQYWTGSTFGPPILDRVHWSTNTGPNSCYIIIDLYTVYLSGTIPASSCRVFNRCGLPVVRSCSGSAFRAFNLLTNRSVQFAASPFAIARTSFFVVSARAHAYSGTKRKR